tara:strand:+ start:66 stop:350 length:285 start_codon:yes stop_codon:yes gene_type:complete
MKTVNFIEAINSGKSFNCKWYNEQIFSVNENNEIEFKDGNESVFISLDFFNSQFEIEEKEVTITESQFEDAYYRVFGTKKSMCPGLKKELGFFK